MTSYTARFLSTDRLQKTIHQVNHNFGVGDLIINAALIGPPNYILAKADSLDNSHGTMMVSFEIDVDNFVATQVGYIPNITEQGALTAGRLYYLSPALLGALTAARPTSAGQVILPCFVADSVNSGFFFGGTGEIISSGGVFGWQIATISGNLAVNNGYISQSGETINLTLPATAALGDLIRVTNILGGFSIRQNPNQIIFFGQDNTNTGVGGHLDTTNLGDTLELVCVVPGASTGWQVISSIGNFTIV